MTLLQIGIAHCFVVLSNVLVHSGVRDASKSVTHLQRAAPGCMPVSQYSGSTLLPHLCRVSKDEVAAAHELFLNTLKVGLSQNKTAASAHQVTQGPRHGAGSTPASHPISQVMQIRATETRRVALPGVLLRSCTPLRLRHMTHSCHGDR